jgi:hypothetical protein
MLAAFRRRVQPAETEEKKDEHRELQVPLHAIPSSPSGQPAVPAPFVRSESQMARLTAELLFRIPSPQRRRRAETKEEELPETPVFPESFRLPFICAAFALTHPDIEPLREIVGLALWDEAVEMYRRDLFETRLLIREDELVHFQEQSDGRYLLRTQQIEYLWWSPASPVHYDRLRELYDALMTYQQNSQT